MEDALPRKRAHVGNGSTLYMQPDVEPRRVLRVRRTPSEMDVEIVVPERKRPASRTNDAPAKRARSTTTAAAARRPRRARKQQAVRQHARRTDSPAHRNAVAAAVAQALRERAEHFETPIEIIEEIIADELPREVPPQTPSVQAALLADGRCAVRIVRENGVVQGVIIDAPVMY